MRHPQVPPRVLFERKGRTDPTRRALATGITAAAWFESERTMHYKFLKTLGILYGWAAGIRIP